MLLVVNVITIVVGVVLLSAGTGCSASCSWSARSRCGSTASASSSATTSSRGAARTRPGDLATLVEESVHGIRVLKAFGRGRTRCRASCSQAEELRGTEIEKAQGRRRDLAVAAARARRRVRAVPPGRRAGERRRADRRQLVAFFATATVLRFPLESIGFLLSMLFDTRTATDRLFEVFDEENTITDPAPPKHITEARGRLAFEGVHFALPGRAARTAPTCSTASTWRSSRGRRWRSSG